MGAENLGLIYIVHNPASTNAKVGERFIDELREQYGSTEVKIIRPDTTTKSSFFQNLIRASHSFDENDILGVAAGDGTVNGVLDTMLTHPDIPKSADKISILPLWSGNANDLASMLNGNVPRKIIPVIENARKVKIYPIMCELKLPDGTNLTRIAACYASFGASAYAAKHLNSKHHRTNPIHRFSVLKSVSETVAALNGVGEAKQFRIVERGKTRTIYERLFINGSRFAKNQLFPTQLAAPGYTMITLKKKNLVWVFLRLVYLFRKKKLHQRTRRRRFTIQDDIVAQFDGEPYTVKAGTKVSIYVSAHPFYALSTLLDEKNRARSQNV